MCVTHGQSMFMTPPEFSNSLKALPFTSNFSMPHVRKKEYNTLFTHFWSWVFNGFKVCPCTGTTAILVSSFFNHFRVKNTFSSFKSHSLFILKRVFIKVLKLFECISNHCRTCSYCGFFFHTENPLPSTLATLQRGHSKWKLFKCLLRDKKDILQESEQSRQLVNQTDCQNSLLSFSALICIDYFGIQQMSRVSRRDAMFAYFR